MEEEDRKPTDTSSDPPTGGGGRRRNNIKRFHRPVAVAVWPHHRVILLRAEVAVSPHQATRQRAAAVAKPAIDRPTSK
jgi:hypothetical protein